MKKSILLLLFFTLFLHGYIKPSWYPNNESKIIYAYGDAKSLIDAKKDALENIKTILISNGKLDTLDNLSLNSLSIEKKEKLENRYFLKVSYNVQSLQEQIKSLLKQEVFKTDDENNTYLIYTPLMEDLNQSFGYYPSISIDKNSTSFLQYKDTKITITKNDYDLFYSLGEDENISLILKDNLLENEKYFIEVKASDSGYLSLFQISLQNDVETLFSNRDLNETNSVIYPNFKESDGLIASLNEDETLRDIYTIAIVCEDKKDFSNFNNRFKLEYKDGLLGEFINTIDKCKFSAQIITIQKEENRTLTQE